MLEVGLVLLHLHHEVVQVDELRADGQAAEGGLVEDLVEAVVVLDQLGQGALRHKQEVESLPVWNSSTQEVTRELIKTGRRTQPSPRRSLHIIASKFCVLGLWSTAVVVVVVVVAHLDDAGSIFEVGEGPHDVLTHGLHRLLPRAGEAPNQLSDANYTHRERHTQEVMC